MAVFSVKLIMANYGYGQYEYQRNGPMPTGYPSMPAQYPQMPTSMASMQPPMPGMAPPPVASMHHQPVMPSMQPAINQMPQQQQSVPPVGMQMNQMSSSMYPPLPAKPAIPPSYASQRRELDPDTMPSVVQVADEDLQKTRKDASMVITARPLAVPPLVSSIKSRDKFIISDGGCARPNHFRSTLYQVPVNEDTLKSSSLPFAIVITPFAQEEIDGDMVGSELQ